jgi:hypothetical protein
MIMREMLLRCQCKMGNEEGHGLLDAQSRVAFLVVLYRCGDQVSDGFVAISRAV